MNKDIGLPMPFGWFVVALSDELSVGDVRPLHYFDQELVLFRNEAGEAAVLDAYCPHLGAHLGHGGAVQGNNIQCPFHHWQFSREGMVDAIPYAKNIPPRAQDKACIYAWPIREVNRAIWVWYHPDRIEPSFEVEPHPEFDDDDWTEPQCSDWTFRGAIQETSENGVDAAHFTYVHSSQSIPQGTVTYEGPSRRAYFESKAPGINKDGSVDTTGTKWREAQLLTTNHGPGQTWQKFTGLFDTCMQGTVTPIDANTVHLRFMFMQLKQQDATAAVMGQGLMDEITRQVTQDIPIWEHKMYRPDPVLCDGDGPIAKHRKWFSQFYAEWQGADESAA